MSVARAKVLDYRPKSQPLDREPWIDMDAAGEHLGYRPSKYRGQVARQFCQRKGIRLCRRGGKVLLTKKSWIDAFVETGRAPRV